MRPREEDGIDYIFVTKEKFESWIKDDELLEHALVYGEYKGILRSQIAHALANKQDVVLRLDVQGAATMRRLMPDAVTIFLVSPATLATQPVSDTFKCVHQLNSVTTQIRSQSVSARQTLHVQPS